jgi:hypothetical protein
MLSPEQPHIRLFPMGGILDSAGLSPEGLKDIVFMPFGEIGYLWAESRVVAP